MKPNDSTLVSELRFLADHTKDVEVFTLLMRAIKELARLEKDIARLEKSNSDYMWEKYPDRMGS